MTRTYNPNEVRLHKEESGCILSWWASVPGHLMRCVGHVHDTTREEAIRNAIQFAKNVDLWDELEAKLRSEFPSQQLYKGSPEMCHDVDWTGYENNREYLYVLKARRKNGKYQIAKAYTLI